MVTHHKVPGHLQASFWVYFDHWFKELGTTRVKAATLVDYIYILQALINDNRPAHCSWNISQFRVTSNAPTWLNIMGWTLNIMGCSHNFWIGHIASLLNTLSPCGVITNHLWLTSLVKVMAYCLSNTKPSSELIITYWTLGNKFNQTSNCTFIEETHFKMQPALSARLIPSWCCWYYGLHP